MVWPGFEDLFGSRLHVIAFGGHQSWNYQFQVILRAGGVGIAVIEPRACDRSRLEDQARDRMPGLNRLERERRVVAVLNFKDQRVRFRPRRKSQSHLMWLLAAATLPGGGSKNHIVG